MKFRQTFAVMSWMLASFAFGPVGSFAQDEHKPQGATEPPAKLNKPFEDPKLDVQGMVKRFESDSREVYKQREAILRAVGVQPGESVADIGAGTGLYTQLFAEKVGPKGTVYAVDISPAFLKHIAEQAKKLGRAEVVKTVQGTQDATNLPPNSVDLVFICDTYHHFEHPERVLASIHRALKPGGRLVIVDFDLREISSEMIKHHARAPKEVYFREVETAGFESLNVEDAPKLEEDFFAAFRRVEKAPSPTSDGKSQGDTEKL